MDSMLIASDFGFISQATFNLVVCMAGVAVIGGFIVGILRGVLWGIVAVPAIFLVEIVLAVAVSIILTLAGFRV